MKRPASQPLVTVIVPTYNCADYLPRALSSVFSQTYKNTECLVIDDGSTDNTNAVLERYTTNIQVLRQGNNGAASARNLGLRNARGSYIAFLDADDYWHPTKLAKQVEIFLAHPHLALVSCDFQQQSGPPTLVLLANDADLPCSSKDFRIYNDFLTIFRNPYLGTPTVMVPTAVAHQLEGFDERLPIAEDIDFWLRACFGRSYAHISQPLAYVHTRSHSLTADDEGYRHNLTVLDRAQCAWPAFYDQHRDEFIALRLSIYRKWVATCLLNGNTRKARAVLRESKQYGRISNRLFLTVKSYLPSVLFGVRTRRD